MIKNNYIDEFEYYCGIIEKYENSRMNIEDFCISTFISKEIISIMNQYKTIINSDPIFTEVMDNIVKNTIILLQSFFIDDKHNIFKTYSQMNVDERDLIKTELISLVNN